MDWQGIEGSKHLLVDLNVRAIFNGPTPASFLFIFCLFKQTLPFLQQIEMKNVHPVYGFEPRPFIHESSPITTRPGLTPYIESYFN